MKDYTAKFVDIVLDVEKHTLAGTLSHPWFILFQKLRIFYLISYTMFLFTLRYVILVHFTIGIKEKSSLSAWQIWI